MTVRTRKSGPWPLGRDAFHSNDPSSPVYSGNRDTPPHLLVASNVDIDDTGRVTRRVGLTNELTLTAGRGSFSDGSLFLVQDNGVIKSVDTSVSPHTTTDVVTGIETTRRVLFHRHADKIYWSDGVNLGWIKEDGTATNWGCATPAPPFLTIASSGGLDAGTYLVATAFIDGEGILHSASLSSSITITAGQGIVVDPGGLDPDATYVEIYVTNPDADALNWCATVAVADLPYTINDAYVSTDLVKTQLFSPPIAPDCMFSYRGMVVLGIENGLFPSYGAFTHLYDIANAQEYRRSSILGGVGLDDGFWTITQDGAFWTSGAMPDDWDTVQVSDREFCAGSLVIPGYLAPVVGQNEDVALFVSEDGLMVGSNSGSMTPVTPDREHLDVTGKYADIIYRKHKAVGNKLIRQILFSLG